MLRPEDIREAIEGYVFNQHPPDDELDEIGGKYVSMDGIRDIEIESQTESNDGIIVTGSASLDVDTDLGDGDGFSDSYPMTFSYLFDDSGRILRQLKRHIDTSSFFAGAEDVYGDLVGTTGSSQLQVFQDSMLDIQNLLHRTDTPGAFVRRLLYVHVVTALESYLFDFLAAKVLKDDASMQYFIETAPIFQNQLLKASEIYKAVESVKNRIRRSLERVNWHHPEDAAKLYVKVLGITFPSDLNQVKESVRLRNILIHRNGRLDDDTVREVSQQDVLDAMQAAEALVNHIENAGQTTGNVAGPVTLLRIDVIVTGLS
jgi:SepF-like predicted cell division protein (DUF552 family)